MLVSAVVLYNAPSLPVAGAIWRQTGPA
jgi:hypothetical protein